MELNPSDLEGQLASIQVFLEKGNKAYNEKTYWVANSCVAAAKAIHYGLPCNYKWRNDEYAQNYERKISILELLIKKVGIEKQLEKLQKGEADNDEGTA